MYIFLVFRFIRTLEKTTYRHISLGADKIVTCICILKVYILRNMLWLISYRKLEVLRKARKNRL